MADNVTALTNIQYHDELGREIQTVLKNYSSVNAYDIVTQIQYDAVGRDSVTWLPIVSSGNGDFVPANIFNGANSTKNTLYLGDQYAYNQVDYLPSPINRITRKYGAGTDWRSGQEKYVSYIYQANLENEVAQFTADGNGNLTRLGFYPPNTLYKVIIEDEDNNKTTEFKDQLGRVIMSQAFNGDIQHN
ncbi:MAG: DUF6443 domain-containing protein, partial [Burkholderiales bacterium]|nr:DUF6443 domain-containing protein [Burkholderiales bacterium]